MYKSFCYKYADTIDEISEWINSLFINEIQEIVQLHVVGPIPYKEVIMSHEVDSVYFSCLLIARIR